ncbi:MAG: DUF485 domain-containing protein [Planctomycetales bacterium]|nr:DUF485 domain-containing protein [Planctomycetales bacterium]
MNQSRNARVGLWLCALYILLYGGFVLIGAFRPDWMERTPWLGVNLAIWYGFGLIVAAIVLAVAYGVACRHEVVPTKPSGSAADGQESPQ